MNSDLGLTSRWRVKTSHSFRLSFLLVTALATQASSDTVLIDDFNDGNFDGWTTIDSTAGQSYGPGTFDAGSGAYHLEGAGIINEGVRGRGFLASIWDQSSDPIYSDGFLRATVRAETKGTTASLALRTSGSLETGFNTYLFIASTADFGIRNGGFLVNRIEANGTFQAWFLDRSFSFGVNEDWNIEAGAVDDELTLKVWRLGDPEPEFPQLTVFDSSFSTGAFGVETEIHGNPFGGPARVSATFDDIYFTFPGPGIRVPECDFNGDEFCDGTDINQLMADAATDGTGTDLNGDGIVDNADRDQWLALAGPENGFVGPLLVGDSDTNGTVDAIDLNALALSWQNPQVFNWTSGNFSVTGGPGVNAADLNALALNWQASSVAAASQAVPEPTGFGLMLLAAAMGGLMVHRRTASC